MLPIATEPFREATSLKSCCYMPMMYRPWLPIRSLLAFVRFTAFTLVIALIAACGSAPRTTVTKMPDAPSVAHPNDSLLGAAIQNAMEEGTTTINLARLESDTALTMYLEQLARMEMTAFTSHQQQLTFWINAHNAYVLDLLRRNQPAQSTSDISGFKSTHVALIGGKFYSLDEIEHTILTHDFREPRAFFALWDASMSSPPLLDVPYREQDLSDQLNQQIRDFLADSTKNYLDKRSNTLYLAPIFEDYESQLDKWVGGTLIFLRDYEPPELSKWIARHPNIRISYLSYNGALDLVRPASATSHEPRSNYYQGHRRVQSGIR